jgi:hypothetical protein
VNVKTIAGIAIGGVLGYKIGERFVDGDLGRWGGGALGAFAGYHVGKRL